MLVTGSDHSLPFLFLMRVFLLLFASMIDCDWCFRVTRVMISPSSSPLSSSSVDRKDMQVCSLLNVTVLLLFPVHTVWINSIHSSHVPIGQSLSLTHTITCKCDLAPETLTNPPPLCTLGELLTITQCTDRGMELNQEGAFTTSDIIEEVFFYSIMTSCPPKKTSRLILIQK